MSIELRNEKLINYTSNLSGWARAWGFSKKKEKKRKKGERNYSGRGEKPDTNCLSLLEFFTPSQHDWSVP